MFYKLVVLACAVLASVDAKHIKGIQIKNRGHERLWVEMTDEDGFFLPPGQMASIVVEDTWTGRIWAQSSECKTKQCTSPYTVAIMKFQGEDTDDKYYVSFTDGFNKPIKIQPTAPRHGCKTAECSANINHHCPQPNQIKNAGGAVVACKFDPELFQRVCPLAITSEEDIVSKMLSCRSNTYLVLIG